MKTLPDEIKRKLATSNSTITYVKAVVKFKDGSTLTLTPANFKISDNSYTQSGGDGFPLGLAICKTITINIDNTNEQFNDYDWYGAEIRLYSQLYFTDYNDPTNNSSYDIFEGIFYVSKIKDNVQYITLTANDFMSKLEISTRIINVPVSGGSLPKAETLGKYFLYTCDDISIELYGISTKTIYSSSLVEEGEDEEPVAVFTNAETKMSIINEEDTTDANNITYRDILGYIAQLAGGNLVVSYEIEDGEYVPKVNIIEYSFLDFTLISCGRFGNEVDDIIDCGTFGDSISDTINCGTFGDTNYILLDKFSTTPDIEFSGVTYTGIKVRYPVVGSNNKGILRAPAILQETPNEFDFTNPVFTYNPTPPSNYPFTPTTDYNQAVQEKTRAQNEYNSQKQKSVTAKADLDRYMGYYDLNVDSDDWEEYFSVIQDAYDRQLIDQGQYTTITNLATKYQVAVTYTKRLGERYDSKNDIVVHMAITLRTQAYQDNIVPSRQAAVDTLYQKLCRNEIRPFSGNYLTYPTAEFMDNVIIMNRKGDLYKSFITEHEYKYLSSSAIKNSTPTVAENNQRYYDRNWE